MAAAAAVPPSLLPSAPSLRPSSDSLSLLPHIPPLRFRLSSKPPSSSSSSSSSSLTSPLTSSLTSLFTPSATSSSAPLTSSFTSSTPFSSSLTSLTSSSTLPTSSWTSVTSSPATSATSLGAYRRGGAGPYREAQVQPDAPKVERGKFPYDLENVINELSALAPRGSISRCMEAYKSKLTMQDFSLIFREFAKRGDWQRAFRLFKYMQRQQWCRPTEHIYTIMIGIMGREGMLDRASELFEEMPENDVAWNVYSFTALINAYGRNGQYETSLELLERMKRAGVMPNVITYNTILNACAKCGLEWEALLDLFAQMRHEGIQPDLITYNTLLSACSSRGLVEAAALVFRTLNDAGVAPDALTYASLVDTCERAGQLGAVGPLLGEMERAGNVPDVAGYNSLIDAYRRNGQYREAEEVLKQMQSTGCVPNVETYSMLLEAYGEHGCYAEVRNMVREMKERGIDPDVFTYHTLVDVFGKGGYYKEAVSLLGDMSEGGITPDMTTYSALFYACGKGALFKEAREISRHMQSQGVSPSQDMIVAMICAYGYCGLYGEAASALESFANSGATLDIDPYNALLDSYAKGGLRVPAAATFMEMMERRNIEPSVDSLNFMIEACGRAGQFNESIGVYRDLLNAGYRPNEATGAALVGVYCGAGMLEEARAQFLEMQAEGWIPEATTYCLLLSLFARRSRWEEAGRLLEEMRSFRMPAEHRFLRGLLLGECDVGQSWQMVDHFLDDRKVDGVASNTVLSNAVLEALWHLGCHLRAERFLETVQQRGIFGYMSRKSDTIWAVDLHRMTTGSAMVMLHTWLRKMRTAVLEGEKLPPLAAIVTTWGNFPEPTEELKESPLRKAIHSSLRRLDSPFKLATWNHGRLVSQGSDLEEWLRNPKLGLKLEISDSLLPIGNVQRNSTIRLADSSRRKMNVESESFRAG